jgi:hypothetical protein
VVFDIRRGCTRPGSGRVRNTCPSATLVLINMQHVLINHVQQSATPESHVLLVFDEMPTPRPNKCYSIFDQLFYVFIVVYLWYFIVIDTSIHFD